MGWSAVEQRTSAAMLLNARRPASLKAWSGKQVAGQPVMDYALTRIGLLLPPGLKITVRGDRKHPSSRHYDAKFSIQGGEFFAGTAVAITPDGYFLTAAHCMEKGAATLVTLRRGGLRASQARVVWCGRLNDGEPDLALLHADAGSGPVFPMRELSGMESRDAVFTAGFGSQGLPSLKAGGSGGRIVKPGPVLEAPGGVRWREILHDAPLAPGDSGGPLLDGQGRLLGLNTEISRGSLIFVTGSPSLWFYRGTAVAPDPAWIQSLIDKDRAARRQ